MSTGTFLIDVEALKTERSEAAFAAREALPVAEPVFYWWQAAAPYKLALATELEFEAVRASQIEAIESDIRLARAGLLDADIDELELELEIWK
jgi:hypothetical protein